MGTGIPISYSDLGMEAFKEQIKEVEKQVERLGTLLKRLKNLANQQKPGCAKGTAVDRSRVNMTNAVTKKFKDLIAEFQVLRQNIQDEHREIVERRVITVTGTIPDEKTIDDLIETGNSDQLFQRALQEGGRGQMLDTVEEIQERHDTVRDIERKLLDLQQIYLDLAILVDAQGEIIDNIEIQVSKAINHVQTGTVALQIAKKHQKSSRKWIFLVVTILLVAAAVIVVSILHPWKKG
ncbi:hypothetical protein Ancab_008023 [Ancistrocladus abbreviatus]